MTTTRPRHHADETADALYQAVVTKPFDTLPRLVLADRLQELGEDERAEFIRVQVELDQNPPCSGSANRRMAANCSDPYCRACMLRDREVQLCHVLESQGVFDAIHSA